MKIGNLKIGYRLYLGFGLVTLLTMAMGVMAISGMLKLADLTSKMYHHPLTVSNAVRVPVIASGGAGNAKHMADALLEGKADAALAASIFHFGEYTVNDVRDELRKQGIATRNNIAE